jgi:hypothetical protein
MDMKSLFFATISLICLTVSVSAQSQPKQYAITSWGDLIALYGPGTDPSMDTPEAVEHMIQFWKARGYTGVYMRTDLGQIEPLIRKNPIRPDAPQGSGNSDPRLAWLYAYIDRVQAAFDFHRVGAKVSQPLGFEWWAWHPHLYSDGAPETAGAPGVGRIWPWTYVDRYKFEHPEIISVDRAGNPFWMVREYAYPGARDSKVAEFVHIAKTFGVKRFVACMRSESTQIQDEPEHADQYGFNKIVVDDMKRLYDVDILTDPRFDHKSGSFSVNDPMLQKWRELRGSYVTQFYRDLRKALREVDPAIQLAVTLSGDTVGPPLGNWTLDWQTWVREGLVDAIITPVTFEASLVKDPLTKGYLTSVRDDKGVVSHRAIKEFIASSKHPEIQVISTNAPPYLFDPPPAGADGWRVDGWYSLYHLAWYQRWWTQCVKDVETQGYIRFLDQNFDSLTPGESGLAGGIGDSRYNPAIHACPGVWYPLGKDAAGAVIARDDGKGNCIQLRVRDAGANAFTGFHNSFPDRSGIYSGIDNAITNGSAVFAFDVFRPHDGTGLEAYLQDQAADRDVAVRIDPETGALSCAIDDGSWRQTEATIPTGKWQRIEIRADLDRQVYSASIGASSAVCPDIPMKKPAPRIIAHPNDATTPISVPSYKMFRQVSFTPIGKETIHIDDVLVRWTPTLNYTKPRPKVFFEDDFERLADNASLNRSRTSRGGQWTTHSESGPTAFTITNDTSFGEGVKALLATAGGSIVGRGEPLRHIPNSYITVDLDVYVRSDRDYPYLMPDPTATSTHWATIGLRRKNSTDHAATALPSRGTWWLWDGTRFVDTRTPVAYDVWNHLQIAVDAPTGSYRVVVQPVGEMPTLVGTAKLGEAIIVNTDLEFAVETSDTQGHISLYDNIRITAGARP